MNFVVDKQNNKVKVTREFAAPLAKVWAAWTQSELLDQWWAPKPWKAIIKKMEFKEGGHWLYVMAGPEGEEHWCRADFKSISPNKSFKVSEAFCDPNGKITNEFPIAYWHCKFSEASNKTTVDIEIEYDSLADLEKYIEMGFKEGFTSGLNNLDELLASGKE
jgi:PhnB protein